MSYNINGVGVKLNILYKKFNAAQRGIRRSVRPILIELTRRKREEKNKRPVIRSAFLEWNRDAEIYAFNVRLSEKFDADLLEQALTHRL